MIWTTKTVRLVTGPGLILALGFGGGAAFGMCPDQAKIEAAELPGLGAMLDAQRGQWTELESAQCLHQAAQRLVQSEAATALKLSTEAVEIFARVGSRRDLSDAYFVDARLRISQSLDPAIRESLQASLELCDEDRECQAERLLSLADFERQKNQLDTARKRAEAARDTLLELHAAEHPLLADALRSLSQVAYHQGNYDEELSLLEQALALQQRLLEPDDLRTAATSLLLGFALADRGQFDAALTLYQRSLDIREKALGSEHTDTAASMFAVGSVAIIRGDYLEAQRLIEGGVAIRERLLPPNHPNLATGYRQLGTLLERMGDHDGSERAIRQSMVIAEHNETYHHLMSGEYGLAFLAMDRGQLEQSKVHAERALKLMDQHNYTGHMRQDSRELLAEVYRKMGYGDAALRLHKEVLAERTAMRPEGDHRIALSRLSVAILGLELGDRTQLAHAQAALADMQRVLPPGHPRMEEHFTRMAEALASQGLVAEAGVMAVNALDVRLGVLAEATLGLSEAEALRYADDKLPALDLALALAEQHPDKVALGPVWNRLMGLRDLVLRRVAGRLALAQGLADPDLAAASQALKDSSERYVRLLLRKLPGDDRPTWLAQLELARSERDRAERALAQMMQTPYVDQTAPLERLRERLEPTQALITFVVTRSHDQARYAALVARHDGAPRILDSGAVTGIDQAIGRWRQSLQEEFTRDQGKDSPALQLAHALLRPLLSAAGDARQLLVIPAGALHLLPWSALPLDDGRFLIEQGPTVLLLHRESELNPDRPDGSAPNQAPNRGLLALGGPLFDRLPEAQRHSRCAAFAEHEFAALPDSAAEVTELGSLWSVWRPAEPVSLRLGADASEANFRLAAPGQRILHLATHAFFVDPDRCQPDMRLAMRGVGALVAQAPGDPVSLAGLALANANQRQRLAGNEDGILAAEEIALLNLRGVELAVLSACDTALGTLTNTEGVLGLRRAFRLAGVRTLVTSLWPVRDDLARQWMRGFYARAAGRGEAAGEAAWAATAELVAERRAKGLDLNPVYWAGFVATGI